MTALKLVKREIGPRHWYSLVRLDDDRVAMGGLRSPGEAEAWAMEAGHTLVNAPNKKSTAAPLTGGGALRPLLETRPEPRHWPTPVEEESARPEPTSLRETSRREGKSLWQVRKERAGLPKDEAPCCLATRDELGRLCIGYCGPDCLRRPA